MVISRNLDTLILLTMQGRKKTPVVASGAVENSTDENLRFNWQVAGHTKVRQYLQRTLEQDRLSHAYLFIGPRGVGKRTLGRAFAQMLLCQSLSGIHPCGRCVSCTSFSKGFHPDFSQISPSATNSSTSIETVREIRSRLTHKPAYNHRAVVLLTNIEGLTSAAANGLLKTLEEPSPGTILILTAQSEAETQIPSTLRSRCQTLYLTEVPDQELTRYLESRGIERAVISRIRPHAKGRIGIALSCSENREILERYEKYSSVLQQLSAAPRSRQFSLVQDLLPAGSDTSHERHALTDAFTCWSIILRDALYVYAGMKKLPTRTAGASALAKKYTPHTLADLLTRCLSAIELISRNVQPRLVAESFITYL